MKEAFFLIPDGYLNIMRLSYKIALFGVLMVRRTLHILLFLTVFLLAGMSGANASVSHDHHEGVSNSPFEGKSNNHSLHCQLNKHHRPDQPCPHIRSQDGKEEARLAVDCDGNHNGTVPTVPNPSKSHVLFSAISPQPVLTGAENIFISSESFQHFFPNPIVPPPRSY